MKNKIPTKKEEIIALCNQLVDGLDTHETEINIKQNTKAVLLAALATAVNAKAVYDTAVSAKAVLADALETANDNVKTYIGAARGVLVYFLGAVWTQLWMATGFPDQSTAVPRTPAAREVLIKALKEYFTANAAKESPSMNVTALIAGTLATALAAARKAYTDAVADCTEKKNARDEAFAELTTRIRGLIAELKTVLDDNDPRWLAFGLNMPGAEATPDVPQGVLATLIGPTAAAMKWNAAPRATYYRVWKKVVGVDAEFVAIGSPADLDFTFEGLPNGSTIQIAVSAVNDGGESALSGVATLTTHA